MSYKVDLHTHSYGSPDGALRAAEYRRKLESGALDFIAITDHDRIDSALQIRGELDKLGDRIIIGEEISTADGELIGLYLTDLVPAGLSAVETTQAIRGQGGLVYVPHPFETVRSGMPEAVLGSIAEDVDIVETYNGRAAFQDCGAAATAWLFSHFTPQPEMGRLTLAAFLAVTACASFAVATWLAPDLRARLKSILCRNQAAAC